MSPLPWYAIWATFSTHEKTLDLCDRVRDRNAGMYVVRLLEHCATHALDGRIKASVVEEVASWRGKRGVLLAALDGAGILDVEDEVRIVHGWVERNGGRIEKAIRDNAKPRGNKAEKTAGPSPVPRGTVEGRVREVEGEPAGHLRVDRHRDGEEEKPTEPAAASEQKPAGGGELDLLRGKLAKALGVPRIGIGKRPSHVLSSFERWLRAGVTEEELVVECVQLAAKKGVSPAHLAWWAGWLDTVSDEQLAAPRMTEG